MPVRVGTHMWISVADAARPTGTVVPGPNSVNKLMFILNGLPGNLEINMIVWGLK